MTLQSLSSLLSELLVQAIRVFFMLRSLSLQLRGEPETQLPLTREEDLIKTDDVLDLIRNDSIKDIPQKPPQLLADQQQVSGPERGPALLPRLECSVETSKSWAQVILLPPPAEWGARYVAQAGLELVASSEPPASASQCAGIRVCGTIIALCNLEVLGSRALPTSAYRVAGTTGMHYHVQLIFKRFVKTGSCYVVLVDLKLLGLSDPLASTSQSTGITDVSLCIWPWHVF
ncbi:Protein CLEC16A [Plecturocebus cupreus]